jgi:adenosylcobinamide-GDP ribazoletransferase
VNLPDMRAGLFRQRAEEFGLALGLLTRLPLPAFTLNGRATIASAFWAFPLAGAAIGILAAIVFWLSLAAGLSGTVAAILAVAAALLAGGGLHEDGFGDFWDGLGGGETRDAKLEIMRDSRLGTYGALALFVMLGLQIALLTDIHEAAGARAVVVALIVSEAVARGGISLPCLFLEPARTQGLGVEMADLGSGTLIGGVAVAAGISFLLLGLAAIVPIIGAAAGSAFITLFAWHFLRGFTGDVLGAAAVAARIAGLGAMAMAS